MYSRIRIVVSDDSNLDVLAMFQKAFAAMSEKEKRHVPDVVSR